MCGRAWADSEDMNVDMCVCVYKTVPGGCRHDCRGVFMQCPGARGENRGMDVVVLRQAVWGYCGRVCFGAWCRALRIF